MSVNWAIVYHRIFYARENHKPCKCDTCKAYLAEIHAEYWTKKEGQ